MFKGTTSTFKFLVKNLPDMSTIADVWVTVRGVMSHKDFSLTKKLSAQEDITIDSEAKTITVVFSEKETLSFVGDEVQIQFKVRLNDDTVVVSGLYNIPVQTPLNTDLMVEDSNDPTNPNNPDPNDPNTDPTNDPTDPSDPNDPSDPSGGNGGSGDPDPTDP